MKNIFSSFAALFFAALLFSVSCSRHESATPEQTDPFIEAQNEVVFEAVLMKVDDQIDREIAMLEKYNYSVSAKKSADTALCSPVITIVTPEKSKFPKTITFDFGEGCTDAEGNFRAGTIEVHITGPYWETNTVRHARLIDYVYNDLKIQGERHMKNLGPNDEGYIVFDLKHQEKIWSTDNTLLAERDWVRVRTQNRGLDLTTNTDDEIWVTGSAKIQKGDVVKVREITVPLYRPLACQHFQEGIITTFVNNEQVAQLDYGKYVPGDCDNTASWTNGTITKTITLKTSVNYFKRP